MSSSTFRDHTGQDWHLRLTYGLACDVKRETGVNLTLVSQDTGWVEILFGEPGRLVGVLWVLCAEQAGRLNVTAEQFGHRFDGPTLEAAGEALAGAIADFFPRSRIARAIREGLPKVLAEADRKAVEAIDRHVSTASNSAGTAPESSGSIPAG